jgi:hypothetical protein
VRYGKGFILLSCEDTEENMEEARRYIERHKLTQEQVKLVKRQHPENGAKELAVVVKTEVDIRGG